MSTTVTDAPTLSPADRCDGCGAQAYVHVKLIGGGELFFCAHRGGRHADKVKQQAASVRDETGRLADAVATPEA